MTATGVQETIVQASSLQDSGCKRCLLKFLDRFQDNGNLVVLYFVVFFSQFKPSEPFLVDYLVEDKGFDNTEVYNFIFPLFVYLRLPCMACVGIFAELSHFLGGRGILVLGCANGLATVVLTLFGTTLWTQQLAQFTVATSFASRYVVNPMIFSLTTPSECQKHVHIMKSVLLLSNSGSAILGEVLRDMIKVPLSYLFIISLVCQALSVLLALNFLRPEAVVSSPASSPQNVADEHGMDSSWIQSLKAAFSDLLLSMQLRTVTWWTIWALALNAAHEIALTFWQNLLRSNKIRVNHNGYILGGSYLAAAGFVAASRNLRGKTEVLVVVSMATAGLFLWLIALASKEFPFYCYLLLFQCVFEVTTAVSTYQVGSQLKKAVEGSSRSWGLSMFCQNAQMPQKARLTLMFTATGVLASLVEAAAQAYLGSWKSISSRYQAMGSGLLALATVLVICYVFDRIFGHRERRPSTSGPSPSSPAPEDPFLETVAVPPTSSDGQSKAARTQTTVQLSG